MFTPLKKIVIAGACLATIAFSASHANAQRYDRATRIRVNQPFEIPGLALPAGTYVLRLMDVAGTRTVVQLLNADETKSYAIVLGIPDYRLKTPEKTEISFYEAEPGTPAPLRAWFYPGYNHGVEFVYPKNRAVEIARTSGEHVIANAEVEPKEEPTPSELETEPLIAIEPTGEVAELAEVHPPLFSEAPSAPAEPVLTAEAETQQLPKTASPFPLLALIGLVAAGAAGGLRLARSRAS